MNRFVFANPNLCIGCDTCLAACAEVHIAEGMQSHPRLAIARTGKISQPITCRHCDNAPCVSVCPVNAITVRGNSISLDESVCNGCLLCVPACPFDIIAISDAGTDKNTPLKLDEQAHAVAVKCDLCDFSTSGPECVKACPTGALFLVDPKSLRRSSNEKRKVAASNLSPALIDKFTK